MLLAEFATNVLSRSALEAAEKGDCNAEGLGVKCCLLADVVRSAALVCVPCAPGTEEDAAAATSVTEDEWFAIWGDAALPVLLSRKTPSHAKSRLSGAAAEFAAVQMGLGNTAALQRLMDTLAVASHPPQAVKALLETKVVLLCRVAQYPGLPETFVASLLEELFVVEDEDWLGGQLHALRSGRVEVVSASPDAMWAALEKRGGGAAGSAACALRLSEIFSSQHLSEGFLLESLSHRTRATRRLTVELMKQRFSAEPWWNPWSAAFTVISDEQPWHLVQPAWQDAVDGGLLNSTMPAIWGKALIMRAASHSDHRVVRRTTQAVLAAADELEMETVIAVIPAALSAGSAIEKISEKLLPHLLQSLKEEGSLSKPAAEALGEAQYSTDSDLVSISRALADLSASWRASGASAEYLTPLAIASLKVASEAFKTSDVHSICTVVANCGTVPSHLCNADSVRSTYPHCDTFVSKCLSTIFSAENNVATINSTFTSFLSAATQCGVEMSRLYFTFHSIAPKVFAEKVVTLATVLRGDALLIEVFKASAEASEETWFGGGNVNFALGEGVAEFDVSWVMEKHLAEDQKGDVLRAVELFVESLNQPRSTAAGWKGSLEDTPLLSSAITDTTTTTSSERGHLVCSAVPSWVWTVLSHSSAPQYSKLLSTMLTGTSFMTHKLRAVKAMLSKENAKEVAKWLVETVLPSFNVVSGEKKKKKKKAGVPRGISELMEAVEGCVSSGVDGEDAEDMLKKCWDVLAKHPVKFAGSRTAYGAFFRSVVQLGDEKGTALLFSFPRLMDEVICQSSIVAAQLTHAAVFCIEDPELLAKLALNSPAPKAQALDRSHPAVVIAQRQTETNPRRVDANSLATVVLRQTIEDTAEEGNDGSAVQIRRVRQWWLLSALLPQGSGVIANAVAAAAVDGLKNARIVPKTRVLIQNAWALCCALHPTQPACLKHLIQTLSSSTTETRLAVSAIIVAAHVLLSGVEIPEVLRTELLTAVIGWSMAMPHAARIHAQLVLAEYLEAGMPASSAEAPFLTSAKRFLDENPHLKTLRATTGLARLVSLYICPQPDAAVVEGGPSPTALPAFSPQSVEMKVLKAMRLVQNRFTELDGEGSGNTADTAMPAAGWASKGSRKCPARARGDANKADDEDESEAESEASDDDTIIDPTHQRRPTPGRPMKGGRARICVVGSFLDNLPNQAGLCRTLEALFGNVSELTLASLKATQEPAFLRMSMASERWLKLLEIPPGERLATYLQRKRSEGFRIVALEQTDNSVSAPSYTFQHDTVLIIGNEQLGCPAWLLRRPELVHDFVELPLDGASRSLNAHVTASAMLWQYRMQTM